MSTETILIEGWLEKKSIRVTKSIHTILPSLWQKRYFVLVHVGKNQGELRYYGTMTPSNYGGNVYGSRKGAIPISSKSRRCTVRREGSTANRFTVIAPRVSGSKHGIGQGSALAGTTLHEYALRAQDSYTASKWFGALHLFFNGDDTAGMSRTIRSESEEAPSPARPPPRSNRSDSEAERRAAVRRRRLAQRKNNVHVSTVSPPPPVVEYKPRPKPSLTTSTSTSTSSFKHSIRVPRSPNRYKGQPPPGIRSAKQIENDRSTNDASINHQAERTKLQSKPPSGVRRPSEVGKSIFQDAMLATNTPPSSRQTRHHERTVSTIHRELTGGQIEERYQQPTAQVRLEAPPPGIRTSSMLDLGVSAASDRNSRNRTPSTIKFDVEINYNESVPPPPSYEPTYAYGNTSNTSNTSNATHATRRDRKFSLIGEILNGTTDSVRSVLNKSPSRRTNRSRTYSSSLEGVGEDRNGNKSELLQSAAKLYEENKITHVHYIQVRDAIVQDDQVIVKAFKSYLKAGSSSRQ